MKNQVSKLLLQSLLRTLNLGSNNSKWSVLNAPKLNSKVNKSVNIKLSLHDKESMRSSFKKVAKGNE